MKLLPERKNGQLVWLCRCECGETTAVVRSSLVRGTTRSCGCLKREAMARVRRNRTKEQSREEKAGSTPYPANGECASYDPERNRCSLLTELLCATRGTCSFFTPASGATP